MRLASRFSAAAACSSSAGVVMTPLSFIEAIVSEIQKTFDFFRATTQEERIDQIYLAGGSARLQGLRELLMERLDTQVELLNPFNAVTWSPKEVDADLVEQLGPAAAIAVGLAVRKVGDR